MDFIKNFCAWKEEVYKMITIPKKTINKFLLSFLFFLYIFQPTLLKINIAYVLDMVFLIIIILNNRMNPKIKINSSIKKALMGFLPFLVYFIVYIIIMLIKSDGYIENDIYYENIKNVTLTAIHLVISVSFMLSIRKKNRYTTTDIIDIYIISSFWQLICVVLSYLSPNVRTFFNNFIINNSKIDSIVKSLLGAGSRRAYGFSGNLFDQFGFVCSLLVVLILIEGIERKKILLTILSFLMLIPSLLNTRTGMFLSLIGMIAVFMKYLVRMTSETFLKGLVITIVVITTGYYVINKMPDVTYDWVYAGIEEIKSLLFKNEKIGTFYTLTKNINLPNNIMFGAGGEPRDYSVIGTDIGYVKSIWRYGVIGTILLLVGYISLFYKPYKSLNKRKNRCIAICFLLLFLLYMIKLFPCFYPGSNFVLFGVPILLMDE